MTDTMIFLSAALIAAGVYIMYLHNLLSRYRSWSRQAAALLAMVASVVHSNAQSLSLGT